MFMAWDNSLATGIELIDSQHQWLFKATNDLYDAVMSQHGIERDTMAQLLEGLVDYTINHFILEESMFQQYGYQDALAHKTEHDAFTARIVRLLQEFEGGADIGMDVLELLKNWLVNHIMSTDMRYVPSLRDKIK